MVMPSRLENLLDLLHTCVDGALATHSLAQPGFPFASHVPFAPDPGHCPLFLISGLAEHTQNLLVDDRASLLLWRAGEGSEVVRATLIGHTKPVEPEPAMIRRYLRYQPAAERLLQFGDFTFFRLHPLRVRVIGGFAQAAWLDGARLGELQKFAISEEEQVLSDATSSPSGTRIVGVDAYGVDIERGDSRQRLRFNAAPLRADAAPPAVATALSAGA
jgi:heme iron utilization protein